MASGVSSLAPSPTALAGERAMVAGAAAKYGINPNTLLGAYSGGVPAEASVPKVPVATTPATETKHEAITSDLLASAGKGLSIAQLASASHLPNEPATDTSIPRTTGGGVTIHQGPSGIIPYTSGSAPSLPEPGLDNSVAQVAAQHGWSAQDVGAWRSLITRESGGSLTATNPTSYAYGIAQMLASYPADASQEEKIAANKQKYAVYGGNADTVEGQLTAMANYIKQRYGSPSAAWAHETSAGWY